MFLGIFTAPLRNGGQLVADISDATSCVISRNEHGDERLSAQLARPFSESLRIYDQTRLLWVALCDSGRIIWEGRLEDPGLFAKNDGSGVSIQALGPWRALSDDRYTALWSKTSLEGFRALTLQDRNLRRPEKFTIELTHGIQIGLKKNEAYTTNTIGSVGYQIPDGSSRDIVGISFQYEARLPTQYKLQLVSFAQGFNSSATSLLSQAGSGSVQRGACHFSLGTSAGSFEIGIAPQSSNTYTGETGDNYVLISHIRIVTSTANRINTTLTANCNAGTNVTATVGSTAGMYVGQQLVIDSGNANSEIVTVISIGSATQFNADFANNHTSGQAVQGFKITADEIVRDVVTQVSTLNPEQLSSSTSQIQSSDLDLLDEAYEDANPADILTSLALLGDTANQRFEVGVDQQRRVYFRPVGSEARAWFVDASELAVERSLEHVVNRIYGTYQDASGRAVRTADSSDTESIARLGIVRREHMSIDTSSSVQASYVLATALHDRSDPLPGADIQFEAIYDARGARWPLYEVKPGDTITIRNLPPDAAVRLDRTRTFRIRRTEYDLIAGRLSVEPDVPLPTLEVMLARQSEGIR